MQLTLFLQSLFENGELLIDSFEKNLLESDIDDAVTLLQSRYELVTLDYPGIAPPLHLPSAIWGAKELFFAAQAAIYRDMNVDELQQRLNLPGPTPENTDLHFSVDLTFAFLPELAKFVKMLAANDPLLVILQKWGVQWPLSSVGMSLESPVNIAPFYTNENLMRYYVDRVIKRGDRSRYDEPRVRKMILSIVGPHHHLFNSLEFQQTVEQ